MKHYTVNPCVVELVGLTLNCHKYIRLCFSDSIHSDHLCRAGFSWQAPMALCCDRTILLEGAQGAVLVAVKQRIPLQGQPAPWVTFSRAAWPRAEGKTLEWAPWSRRWSHGADSIRHAQERGVTAGVGYVAVGAALHELVVKLGLTFFLLDNLALSQRVDLERFLCLHHVCCVFLYDHPAL